VPIATEFLDSLRQFAANVIVELPRPRGLEETTKLLDGRIVFMWQFLHGFAEALERQRLTLADRRAARGQGGFRLFHVTLSHLQTPLTGAVFCPPNGLPFEMLTDAP
jgi:hypothetical protein